MKTFKEQSNLDEAPLVMSDMDMIDTLFNKIKDDMLKAKRKNQGEKNWPALQQLAKMAGAKETPRQKLISLMYLVFITMLALNVSKEVLDGFGQM